MRVVVADDSALFRHGVVRLLGDAGCTVVGDVATAPDLLMLVDAARPDAAIVDIKMPPTHTDEGLRAAEEIRTRFPETGVLVLSQYVEARYALTLLKSQTGVGYLLKEPDRRRHATDRRAEAHVQGEAVVDRELVKELLEAAEARKRIETLTQREREILGLMAEGQTNASMCERLFLSPKTIEANISRIFSKLDLPPGTDSHRRVMAVLAYLRG